MERAIADIEFLARSEARVQILKELIESGELSRSDLKNRLDCSRTTIQRNLEALIERDLISNTHRTYSLTPDGSYFADSFLYLVETTEVFKQLQPFLRWVDRDAFSIDLRELQDADLVLPEDGDPYAMVNRHVTKIKQSNYGFALLPFTGLHATEVAHKQVTEHGAEFELVVESDVAETHQSTPEYRELNKEMVKTNRFRIYEYDDSIPFCLAILDQTVQIISSESDKPRAMIETDADTVRNWAKKTYDAHKEQATRVI